MSLWQRLQRWVGVDVDVDIFGRLRMFLGLGAVCKYIGLTSPLPRLVHGKLDLGLPIHRYHPDGFAPGALGAYADWLPVPTYAQYAGLEVFALVVAVLMTVGLAAQLTTALTALAAFVLLVVDPAGFKHNLWALSVFAGLLALAPCGATHSLDAVLCRRWRRWRRSTTTSSSTTTWILPLRLIQLQVAVIYLFSTLRKFNDGWWTGHLLRSAVDQTGEQLTSWGVAWLAPIVTWTPWYVVGAWLTVLLEGFLAIGFFVPRWRAWALFVGVVLHLWIDLALDVGAYSLVMFAAYVAFIEPTPRAHVLCVPRGHWLSRAWILDWLGRFDIVEGDDVVVVDRDGARVAEGRAAVVFALRRLPLTFVPAFVTAGIIALRQRRR